MKRGIVPQSKIKACPGFDPISNTMQIIENCPCGLVLHQNLFVNVDLPPLEKAYVPTTNYSDMTEEDKQEYQEFLQNVQSHHYVIQLEYDFYRMLRNEKDRMVHLDFLRKCSTKDPVHSLASKVLKLINNSV